MPRPIKQFTLLVLLTSLLAAACQRKEPAANADNRNPSTMTTPYKTTGAIEKRDDRLDQIIPPGAKIEIIAEGFDWSEGPLWLPQQEKLLFSDIPPNKIYQWTEAGGLQLYLTPSGYTGAQPRGGEVGSNGLILDTAGRLVLCQHGDRRMARLDAPLEQPQPQFTTLVDKYDGKRLNSPNDAVYNRHGDLYFTDPPYGL